MTGWQELWEDRKTRERWEAMPPLPEVIEMADRLAREGRRRVLDIGCGLGRHVIYLVGRGFDVVGTDIAPSAVERCRAKLAQVAEAEGASSRSHSEPGAGGTATVLQLDMTQFPWPDGSFDGVIASNVIHHTDLGTLRGIIRSIARVLDDWGYFAWATPSPRHFACGRGRQLEPMTWIDSDEHDGHLPHHYCSEDEVRGLLAGFEILSLGEVERREGEKSRWHWRVLARKRPT